MVPTMPILEAEEVEVEGILFLLRTLLMLVLLHYAQLEEPEEIRAEELVETTAEAEAEAVDVLQYYMVQHCRIQAPPIR
jgi:hypothetical protein